METLKGLTPLETDGNVAYFQTERDTVAVMNFHLVEEKEVGSEYIYAETGKLSFDFKQRAAAAFEKAIV